MAYSSPRTWVTGEVVTAAHMNQEVRDNLNALFPNEEVSDSWSPTLEAVTTNPTTSVAAGRLVRVGPLQFFWLRFVITTPGQGRYFVTLPTASANLSFTESAGGGQAVGGWQSKDQSTGIDPATADQSGSVTLRAADAIQFSLNEGFAVSDQNPHAWAVDDVLSAYGQYTVA